MPSSTGNASLSFIPDVSIFDAEMQQEFCARWQPGHPSALILPAPSPGPLLPLWQRLPEGSGVLLESLSGPADITRADVLGWVTGAPRLPEASPRHPGDSTCRVLEPMLRQLPGPKASLPEGAPCLPFVGGWVLALDYGLARAFEVLPHLQPFPDGPSIRMLEVPAALVVERPSGRAWWVACLPPARDAQACWLETTRVLREFQQTLGQPHRALEPLRLRVPLRSPFTQVRYEGMVSQALQHIRRGDIFQVNLSQRYRAQVEGHPASLYARLREASPAPFAALLPFPDAWVLSSSPERFLEIRGGRIETRPIKGTLRRTLDPKDDARLGGLLRADPKENAEHVMIVDMARNDLGRLCAWDSVEVEELLRVEVYPRLLHLTSIVSGRLKGAWNLWEVLAATFPGASITGAPKVMAMQVIEALEADPRGLYTGAFGLLSRCGRLDLAMAIRTLVIRPSSGQFAELSLQVGGGIVVASDPRREYEETLLKAEGMMKALGMDFPAE